VAWFTTTLDDVGQLTIARITLSADAQGTWKALVAVASGSGGENLVFQGPVVDGQMVPEPGSLHLAALGLAVLGVLACGSKRRR